MMFIAAMAFSACDDDDKNDNITVPDAVSKALKDKYPAAMDIEWERKGNYFVADCWMDGREMDVWYDVQATWKLTETDITRVRDKDCVKNRVKRAKIVRFTLC